METSVTSEQVSTAGTRGSGSRPARLRGPICSSRPRLPWGAMWAECHPMTHPAPLCTISNVCIFFWFPNINPACEHVASSSERELGTSRSTTTILLPSCCCCCLCVLSIYILDITRWVRWVRWVRQLRAADTCFLFLPQRQQMVQRDSLQVPAMETS